MSLWINSGSVVVGVAKRVDGYVHVGTFPISLSPGNNFSNIPLTFFGLEKPFDL